MIWLLFACSADVDETLAALSSDNPVVREEALVDARSLREDAVVARLVELLGDDDPGVRLGAVQALDEIGDPNATMALTGRIDDPDAAVSKAAVTAIGRMGPDAVTAAPALIASLQQQPRYDVLWALGQLGDRSAVPVLASLRSHSDPWVRHNATEALRTLE